MNTKVNIAGVELKNPVMTASGTFGSGAEYGEMVDLNRLGAVVTKGVANVPWPGNPTPRIAEVYGGMLNAIGLQNPGVHKVIEEELPKLRKVNRNVCVGFAGDTLAAVQAVNALDEYNVQYLTFEKIVKVLCERMRQVHTLPLGVRFLVGGRGRKGGFQRLPRAVGVWYNDHIVVIVPAHKAVSAEPQKSAAHQPEARGRCAAMV